MKMSVPGAERERARRFYEEILGAEVIKKKPADFVRFSNDFYLCLVYDDNGLSEGTYLKATWLEVRTADVNGTKKRILAFGIKEVEHWDKTHFYFQAPGGQIFRLAANDMVNGWGAK